MNETIKRKYLFDNIQLVSEWDFEKNSELKLDPKKLTLGSTKKAWWKCTKGHEWESSIANRAGKKHNCPYCSGRYAITGKTDLQTINPSLANEWNFSKNNSLTPQEVTTNSSKSVWWICQNGHEWQAKIANRNRGTGCPVCDSSRHTSFPEYALFFYLLKSGLDAIHTYTEKGYELDIYIPSKKTAIEYDGYFWHKNKLRRDVEKNRSCEKDGIKLYRIREGLPSLNDSSIDYVVQKNQKNLSTVIKKILNAILENNSIDVDVDRDSIDIENLRENLKAENSLKVSNPTLANEWNYTKNGLLKPESFAPNSGKRVWWICTKGHEWQATIDKRNNGTGCPYCSNQKILKGYNDLQTTNLSLAKEWNFKMNGSLTPNDVTCNSEKRVWWICNKGHEWQAAISSRNEGCGCPYCSGRSAVEGINDLQTINPTIADEWNYEKNDKLPMDFKSGSHKKAWWQCKKGHEWEATIDSRSRGNGCPYCSGRYVVKGENDLKTVNPILAGEWNYKKNLGLTPEDVKPNSNKKVWWICVKGHEWEATISNRNQGKGCPYCSGRKKQKT